MNSSFFTTPIGISDFEDREGMYRIIWIINTGRWFFPALEASELQSSQLDRSWWRLSEMTSGQVLVKTCRTKIEVSGCHLSHIKFMSTASCAEPPSSTKKKPNPCTIQLFLSYAVAKCYKNLPASWTRSKYWTSDCFSCFSGKTRIDHVNETALRTLLQNFVIISSHSDIWLAASKYAILRCSPWISYETVCGNYCSLIGDYCLANDKALLILLFQSFGFIIKTHSGDSMESSSEVQFGVSPDQNLNFRV